MSYKIGTCCIITNDAEKFTSNKEMRIGTITVKSMKSLPSVTQQEKLSIKVNQNLTALYNQLRHIGSLPIELRMFRISSGLLPLFDHPEFSSLYNTKLLFVVDHWLSKCKKVVDTHGIRVSTHPDQYCVINSDKDHVRQNAIRTLQYHKYFMERLTTPENGAVINIHLNGKLDHLPEYDQLCALGLDRWLSFENSDRGDSDHEFTLSMCERYNVRYVHDIHHHLVKCGEYLDLNSSEFDRISATWGSVRPKFHVSQSRDDNKIIPAHSDFITDQSIIEYCAGLLHYGDVALEAKAKNMAVTRFYNDLQKL